MKALQNLSEVRNVFLIGSYNEKKFLPFLDFARTMFNFKIHYIEEEIPKNTAGGIFYYKDRILQDHP
jgi:mannose-1-phosphate guanylyltransferase